jgi:hypothetical protein
MGRLLFRGRHLPLPKVSGSAFIDVRSLTEIIKSISTRNVEIINRHNHSKHYRKKKSELCCLKPWQHNRVCINTILKYSVLLIYYSVIYFSLTNAISKCWTPACLLTHCHISFFFWLVIHVSMVYSYLQMYYMSCVSLHFILLYIKIVMKT